MKARRKDKSKQGTLFVVATPIGNLQDLTIRALKTLREVDALVAEDSRHSRRLTERYGIQTPFTHSYYQGAGKQRREKILAQLKQGQDLALLSNAGTPLISDPGFKLVRQAQNQGLKVRPIPGPNAALACLSACGQPTDSFVFLGQLPKKGKAKKTLLEKVRTRRKTTVFYDSPRRVAETLEILDRQVPKRSLSVCRELTKKHEQILKGRAADILQKLEESFPEGRIRGEFTLAVRGGTEEEIAAAKREKYEEIPIEQQYEGLKKFKDLSRKEAIRELARIRGMSRNEVYDALHT